MCGWLLIQKDERYGVCECVAVANILKRFEEPNTLERRYIHAGPFTICVAKQDPKVNYLNLNAKFFL